ncbi:MAG: hypothetical protein ACOH5I_11900 [Oligoflexus sp.]
MFRLIILLSIVKYLSLSSLFSESLAADFRLSSNFGQESNNLSASAQSAGFGFEIGQSFWEINSLQSGLSLIIGNEMMTGKTSTAQRSRIDTVESIYIQAGFHIKIQQGPGNWTLLAASGPLSASLRMNDSTPQSASIFKSQQLSGWQNSLTAHYQYPIGRKVFLSSGVTWKQRRIQLGNDSFSFFEQNFTTGSLTLTEGADRPDNFPIPNEIQSQAWELSLGIMFTI